jgi:SAM-dependent methyltransferase
MGDQKYLDDWPERFSRVHVLRHPGGGLAPWNVTNHELANDGDRVLVDGRPLVFFHYHSLRLFDRTPVARVASLVDIVRPGVRELPLMWTSNYPAPAEERRLVWVPYLRTLGWAFDLARRIRPGFRAGIDVLPAVPTAVRLGRGAARRVRRAMRSVAPLRWSPWRFRRYRDSWRSSDVAAQMLAAAEAGLADADSVPPYVVFRGLLDALVEDPRLPVPARLLDIGCGVGAYGELLERWAPRRFEYVGGDYSAELIAAARSRWPGRHFEQQDVFESLDGYDVILASGLVDVLPDHERALRALMAADARWLIIHRQSIGDRSHTEVAPAYEGQLTYRTSVSIGDLERYAAEHGRTCVSDVLIDGSIRSFLFVADDGP